MTYSSFEGVDLSSHTFHFLSLQQANEIIKKLSPFDVIRCSFFLESFITSHQELRELYFLSHSTAAAIKSSFDVSFDAPFSSVPSRPVSFADPLFQHSKELSASNAPSSLPLGKTNVLFRDFYQQASVILKQHFSFFHLDIETKERNGLPILLLFQISALSAATVSLSNKHSSKEARNNEMLKEPLSVSECLALVNDLDYLLTLETTQSSSVININSINRDVMAACLFTGIESFVRARERTSIDSNGIGIKIDMDIEKVWKDCGKVTMAPIVPSGEDFMVSYEIGIQANPSSFEMNFLHSAEAPLLHKLLLASYFRVASEGATIRYAFTSLLTSIAHESVHFLQTYLGQLQKGQLIANSNSNDVLWSAEFDASVISYSIFAYLSQYIKAPHFPQKDLECSEKCERRERCENHKTAAIQSQNHVSLFSHTMKALNRRNDALISCVHTQHKFLGSMRDNNSDPRLFKSSSHSKQNCGESDHLSFPSSSFSSPSTPSTPSSSSKDELQRKAFSVCHSEVFSHGLLSLYMSSCVNNCIWYIDDEKTCFRDGTKRALRSSGALVKAFSSLVVPKSSPEQEYVRWRLHYGKYAPKDIYSLEHLYKELIGFEALTVDCQVSRTEKDETISHYTLDDLSYFLYCNPAKTAFEKNYNVFTDENVLTQGLSPVLEAILSRKTFDLRSLFYDSVEIE